MGHHVFVINSLASINLAVAVIKGKARTKFRQEGRILQVPANKRSQNVQVRHEFVVQVQIPKPAVVIIAANVIVTIGVRKFKIPTQRSPEQIRRTCVESILVVVEEMPSRCTELDFGTDIFAKHIQVRKGKPKHEAIAVSRFASRCRNPAEDFLEMIREISAFTPRRNLGKQVQVLQTAFF